MTSFFGQESRQTLRPPDAALLLSLAFIGVVSLAKADPVAEFYRDRALTVVSAGEAGGAHGAYLRLIAAHIRKFIPGNPPVNIQYMIGAGGNLAMNYLYNVAPRDGSYVGVPLQDLVFNARLGVSAVKYDATKARYLGGADTTRTTLTVMKTSGVASLEDARKKEVLIGASGASGQNYMIPFVLNGLFGTRFRVVTGYPGIAIIHMAMERGEVQGTAASWPVIAATRPEWVEKKMINNLVTIAMEREPALPETPALGELLSSPDDLALMPMLAGSAALGRAWVTFGDVPQDRLAALRDAFARTLDDPSFRAEAAQAGLPLAPVSWRLQQESVDGILSTGDDTVSRLKHMVGIE